MAEQKTCAQVVELLYRQIDEALSSGEAALLEEHLGACPGCRAEKSAAAGLVRLHRYLDEQALAGPVEYYPVALTRRIAEAISLETPPSAALRQLWRWQTAVQAVPLILLIIGFGVAAIASGKTSGPFSGALVQLLAQFFGGVGRMINAAGAGAFLSIPWLLLAAICLAGINGVLFFAGGRAERRPGGAFGEMGT